MDELIKRLERVIQTGVPDKDGMYPISAEAVLEVVKQLSELSTNLATHGTDCISRQAAIDDIWTVSPLARLDRKWVDRWLRQLPPIQPEIIRCKDCKYWHSGSCECPEHTVNSQDYMIGDIETEAEHFCGYAERREVTT